MVRRRFSDFFAMMLKRQGVKLEQSVSDRDEKSGGAEIVVGNCVVRPATNEIIRDGETLHLEPKSMEVLAYLIAYDGEVISRDELLEQGLAGCPCRRQFADRRHHQDQAGAR